MDRNSLTGLALIALLIIGWAYFFPPTQKPNPKQQAPAVSTADTIRKQDTPAKPLVQDTAHGATQDTLAELRDRFGKFAPAAAGKASVITITTDKLLMALHTQGGYLQPVQLVGYKTFDSIPLPAFPAGPLDVVSLQFAHNNRVIDTRQLYFIPSVKKDISLHGNETQTLTLRAELEPGRYLEHSYTFSGSAYDVQYRFRAVGLGEWITNNHLDLHAQVLQPRTEKNGDAQRNETTLYYEYGDDVEKLSPSSSDRETKQVQGNIKWVSFKSQFFSTAFIAEQPFEAISLTSEPSSADANELALHPAAGLKRLEAYLQVPYNHGPDEAASFKLYYGPNDYYSLKAYGVKLEKQVELGPWGIRWINQFVILPVFKLLEGYTHNYGVIILVLAILIKLVLFPLTFRSYRSNAKVQIVNNLPEVKALDEKFKDDPTKLQAQKMAFYNSAGVSPLAGCIPLLLQLPILLAMFRFFPQSTELRQQPLWWASDLSTYDPIVNFGFKVPLIGDHLSGFAILMTLSQLVITYISQRGQSFSGPTAQLKYMGYITPFIFFGVLNSYSAGLSYYYFVINLLTVVQTYGIKAFINEEKLKAKIHETRQTRKAKPAKPGLLGNWVAEQQKKQDQLLRERRKQQGR